MHNLGNNRENKNLANKNQFAVAELYMFSINNFRDSNKIVQHSCLHKMINDDLVISKTCIVSVLDSNEC